MNTHLDPQSVVVVSGLPRSGTSLMMAMLQAGGLPLLTDRIRAADDDNPRGYFELERVKALRDGDVDWLEDARGRVVKIISYLLPFLPSGYEYRVIFMRRRLVEILASQRQMLIRRGADPDKASQEDVTHALQMHIEQIEAWLNNSPGTTAIRIDYNKLLEEPLEGARQVQAFLGGGLDLERMLSVIDPALYRQRIGS